jgi:hypothetical protein
MLVVVWLAAGLCFAQGQVLQPSDGSTPTFGVTVVDSLGLQGRIYKIRGGSKKLPNFKKMKPLGSIYTSKLNIPTRSFTEGFPGVTNRFEWFAIDYTGRFWIEKPGVYAFSLMSDDGSKLYIDDQTVIDNDGIHAAHTEFGKVDLNEGVHTIRVSYFQGPRMELALILKVQQPDARRFEVFDTHQFRPPQEGK